MSSAVASGLTPKTSCHAVLVPPGASGAADPELVCPGERFGQTALTIMYPRMKKTIAANTSKLPIGDAHGQIALERRQRLERLRCPANPQQSRSTAVERACPLLERRRFGQQGAAVSQQIFSGSSQADPAS